MMRRRDFLGVAALPLRASGRNPACIVLRMRGGPSHLDTWDPKPDAPSEVRGPFRAIKTNVPGIEISEVLPLTARHADKFTIIRSVHHAETAHRAAEQLFALPEHPRLRVIDVPGWDIHGWAPFGSLVSHRDAAAAFDRTFSGLIKSLYRDRRLEKTLLVALGEFGRTPKINPDGGRDHWPHCFSVVMAGGGIPGGEIYGSSDRWGGEPRDNSVTPGMIVATIRGALGGSLAIGSSGLPSKFFGRNEPSGKQDARAAAAPLPILPRDRDSSRV
jgi:hypothetical protein